MNAYIYNAALWCEDCIVEACITNGVLSPAARDMNVQAALEQAREANGWTEESDYDSDDFPKGPNPDGGGEADTPSHCDGCHCHLENPLTSDGSDYVADKLLTGAGDPEVLATWAEFYADGLDVGNDDFRDAAKQAMEKALEFIDNHCPDEHGAEPVTPASAQEKQEIKQLKTWLSILIKL